MSAPIVITAATYAELSLMLKTLGGRKVLPAEGFPVTETDVAAGRVILAVTGMGKINAAATAAVLIERYRPACIINTGCAGAFPDSGLNVGDLAAAAVETAADEGVLIPAGWLSCKDMGIPAVIREDVRYFNEFPLSTAMTERAVRFGASLGLTIRQGGFLTVSTCSGTAERSRELCRRYAQPLCENMEGAAVAQTALRCGVECLEIRGVSNFVEDRDLSRWDIPLAVEQAQRFLLGFIPELLEGNRP